MTVTHTTRAASIDEIAAEMDRRGAVIERLEAKLSALVSAANAISDRNGSYVGNDIVISCASHGEALRLMRELRDAIFKAGMNP